MSETAPAVADDNPPELSLQAIRKSYNSGEDNETEVQVWSVLVLGAKGGSTVRQVWRTSTLELAWTDGDWKVERWATSPGPFPAPPPEADASMLAEASEVMSWRRAPEGSS